MDFITIVIGAAALVAGLLLGGLWARRAAAGTRTRLTIARSKNAVLIEEKAALEEKLQMARRVTSGALATPWSTSIATPESTDLEKAFDELFRMDERLPNAFPVPVTSLGLYSNAYQDAQDRRRARVKKVLDFARARKAREQRKAERAEMDRTLTALRGEAA